MIENVESGLRHVGKTWDLESQLAKHRTLQTVETRHFKVTIVKDGIATHQQLDQEYEKAIERAADK